MNNEIKSDIEKKKEIESSNTRALIIVAGFVVLFICLIAYEVSSK